MSNYYEILGVPKTASADDIKKAYKKLAFECHPDRNQSDPAAEERFKAINEANDVLSNPQKRQKYDNPIPEGNPFGFNPFSGQGFDFNPFGAGGPFNPFGGAGNRGQAGKDVVIGLDISFYEAFFGANKTIEYSFPVECSSCISTCSRCSGSGMERVAAGPNMVSMSTCRACGGRGVTISRSSSCGVCHGDGQTINERRALVTIPPGCENGMKLGVSGGGLPGMNGGRQGNLVIVVSIQKPNSFTVEQKEALRSVFGETPESITRNLR
jgi:molecular chaperone DnaJ